MLEFSLSDAKWLFEPKKYSIENGKVVVLTEPNSDFWQRTYYGIRNDSAHVLYNTTAEKYFTFTVKAQFKYTAMFDQCGIAIYQDSDNWAKAGIEYNIKDTMYLGSVVTNNGYSDWATVDIDNKITEIWYRLSRRESDFLIEYSYDGSSFSQMRIFHLAKCDGEIRFGLHAGSPTKNSFEAVFTDISMSDCIWEKHVF